MKILFCNLFCIPCLLFLILFHSDAFTQKEGYELFWQDEFNGSELDPTKWRYRALGPRRDGINSKNAVHLDGKGNLLLTASKTGDTYHVGMIGTQETFQTTFGYFECRAKLQKEPGHWSAFWLQSPTISQVGDTKINGTEIDIFEYLRKYPNRIYHNTHWNGYGSEHQQNGTQKNIPGLAEGYHLFGLEWTETEYIFYVDNQETWRTSTAISHRSEYIILSTEVGQWAGDIKTANLPDTFFVDYVRVYKKLTRVKGAHKPELPNHVQLKQNYPNPCNPATAIQYKLEKPCHVLLAIYNATGQEIEILVNEFQDAGDQRITWQPGGLPSGIYFYRVKAGEFSRTRKLIFQK